MLGSGCMRSTTNGRVRIIGGKWRGRALLFPPTQPIRPTSNRVRETLFNWLAPRIEGSRCLDLFAGSGALGFEAASRGAEEVVLVESDPLIVTCLHKSALTFDADNLQIIRCNAIEWLEGPPSSFDIVFLDPPFGSQVLAAACQRLAQRRWLRPGAVIYVESERRLELPPLPTTWNLVRQKRAGNVAYYLINCRPD